MITFLILFILETINKSKMRQLTLFLSTPINKFWALGFYLFLHSFSLSPIHQNIRRYTHLGLSLCKRRHCANKYSCTYACDDFHFNECNSKSHTPQKANIKNKSFFSQYQRKDSDQVSYTLILLHFLNISLFYIWVYMKGF